MMPMIKKALDGKEGGRGLHNNDLNGKYLNLKLTSSKLLN